jgi:hypothetical protein
MTKYFLFRYFKTNPGAIHLAVMLYVALQNRDLEVVMSSLFIIENFDLEIIPVTGH